MHDSNGQIDVGTYFLKLSTIGIPRSAWPPTDPAPFNCQTVFVDFIKPSIDLFSLGKKHPYPNGFLNGILIYLPSFGIGWPQNGPLSGNNELK